MDKKKKYLPDHPTNSVPVPVEPYFGNQLPITAPLSPGQELDPTPPGF